MPRPATVDEAYALDWDIQPEGRAWRGGIDRLELAPRKIELCEGRLFCSDEDRLVMLAMLLENVGMNAAIKLAPLERWHAALEAVEQERRR